MKFITGTWKALTYREGKFSASRFFRTSIYFMLLWVLYKVTMGLQEVTFEYVTLVLAIASVIVGDYRSLELVRAMKSPPSRAYPGPYLPRDIDGGRRTPGAEEL